MEIKIRFMTFEEFDQYQDYIDELTEQNVKQNKIPRLAAVWVMEHIYGVDVKTCNMNPGKIMDIITKTVEETMKVETEEEKN